MARLRIQLAFVDRSIINNTIRNSIRSALPDIAQARLQVSNLQGTRLSAWINGQWYARGWQASQGNARLLDSIQEQLKYRQRGSSHRAAVARCALAMSTWRRVSIQWGTAAAGGHGYWSSTAWNEAVRMDSGKVGPPQQYSAPWIDWFRGGKIHLTQLPDRLAVVGTIDLELPLKFRSVTVGEKMWRHR